MEGKLVLNNAYIERFFTVKDTFIINIVNTLVIIGPQGMTGIDTLLCCWCFDIVSCMLSTTPLLLSSSFSSSHQ